MNERKKKEMKGRVGALIVIAAAVGGVCGLNVALADETQLDSMPGLMPGLLPGFGLETAEGDSVAGGVAVNVDSLREVRRVAAFESAVADFDSISRLRTSGEPESTYFPAVYTFTDSTLSRIRLMAPGSMEENRLKGMLKNVHPYLEEGAYYYGKLEDEGAMKKFSRKYVDVRLDPVFGEERLRVNEQYYPPLVYLAASDAYSKKEFDDAIRYFKEFFATGATNYREQVYIFMGQACINSGNYPLAVMMMRDGLKLYPQNFNMTQLGLDACIKGKMADNMQEFLDAALAIKPDDEQLRIIQGQLHEDRGEYQKALAIFSNLAMSHPDNLMIAKHVGLNYYNIASSYSNMAVAESDEKAEKKYRRQAKNYFSDAATVLATVTANDPTAVKYLKALAVSYLFLDNKPMFQDVNAKLQALGEDPLDDMYMPPIMSYGSGSRNFEQTGGSVASTDEIPGYAEYAKPLIESRLAEWCARGEFEKVEDYMKRVNDVTSAEKYQALKKETSDEYLGLYADKLRINSLKLEPYDANNEVYKIDSPYGAILLNVPLKNGEAEMFRAQWDNVRFRAPRYYIKDDKAQLASITFVTPANKTYTFNAEDELTYSIPEIDIDLAGILAAANAKGAGAGTREGGSSKVRIKKKSDVDVDIPVAGKSNPNTLAVIIANEDYANAVDVASAINDGEAFNEYCINTLGIPRENVRMYLNATFGNTLRAIADLRHTAQALGPQTDVIFYYAGHGMPDESSKEAFLMPTDGDPAISESCYPLSRLYKELGGMDVNSVSVFLDACFSGARRDGGMLMAARGVVVKPKEAEPEGNMFVLSAASGQETALPYTEKNHGMFIYYLLKKLQETKGNVTLKELADYVTENVKRQSNLINQKPQTPTVTTSGRMRELYGKKKLRN